MTSQSECPRLTSLADACLNGACNPSGIVHSLVDCLPELQTYEIATNPAFKVILGQLSYLAGESCGPTAEAMKAYDEWKLMGDPRKSSNTEHNKANEIPTHCPAHAGHRCHDVPRWRCHHVPGWLLCPGALRGRQAHRHVVDQAIES